MKKLLKEGLMWGLILWLIGYVLGIVFFAFIPVNILGWVIMPIGILITLWVLFKKVKGDSLKYYLAISVIWTLLAIILDYLLIVRLLNPAEGYYKLDVYLYYIITFALPLIVGMVKKKEILTKSQKRAIIT